MFIGNVYGGGVYFVKDVFYFYLYLILGLNGDCFMYLVRVLVGKYILGKYGWKKFFFKDFNKLEIFFDLLVNKEEDLIIFVVFNDFYVYFKYLISFKK